MQINNSFLTKTPYLAVFSLFIVLASCGSSQYTGLDNDGIYSSESAVEYQEEVAQTEPESSSNTFYKNYFKEKSLEYQLPEDEEDEIFTDVEDYESDYAVAQDTLDTEYNSYAGWGQENTSVSITVNTGFNYGYPFWGHYNPWYYGYSYYPYSYYGWGYYNPWYYPTPYYGYYGGYYGGGYYAYGGRGLAYSSSRRGNYYGNNYYGSRNSNLYNSRTSTRRSSLGNTYNSALSPRTTTRPRTSTNTNTSTPRPSTTTRPRTTTRPEVGTNSTPRPRTTTTTKPKTKSNSGTKATPRKRTNSTPRSSTPRSYSPSSTSGGSPSFSGGGSRGSGGSRGRR